MFAGSATSVTLRNSDLRSPPASRTNQAESRLSRSFTRRPPREPLLLHPCTAEASREYSRVRTEHAKRHFLKILSLGTRTRPPRCCAQHRWASRFRQVSQALSLSRRGIAIEAVHCSCGGSIAAARSSHFQ